MAHQLVQGKAIKGFVHGLVADEIVVLEILQTVWQMFGIRIGQVEVGSSNHNKIHELLLVRQIKLIANFEASPGEQLAESNLKKAMPGYSTFPIILTKRENSDTVNIFAVIWTPSFPLGPVRHAKENLFNNHSRFFESIQMVTGPSLTRETSIMAPNSPVGTVFPAASLNRATNAS